jgi:hypothetical protein
MPDILNRLCLIDEDIPEVVDPIFAWEEQVQSSSKKGMNPEKMMATSKVISFPYSVSLSFSVFNSHFPSRPVLPCGISRKQ